MNEAFWKARKKALYATAMVDLYVASAARADVSPERVINDIDYWTTVQVQAEREMDAAQSDEQQDIDAKKNED